MPAAPLKLTSQTSAVDRCGFTLLELLAVLVIMGILASAAALSLRRTGTPETSAQLVQRLAEFTDDIRYRAGREQRPWVIAIHPGAERLTAHPDGQDQPQRSLPLPPHWDLIAARGGTEDWSGSPVLWACDIHGQGPSFALELRDPQGNYHFAVESGLSGQLVWEERKEVCNAWFKTGLQSH